jgi:hypothetical protein
MASLLEDLWLTDSTPLWMALRKSSRAVFRMARTIPFARRDISRLPSLPSETSHPLHVSSRQHQTPHLPLPFTRCSSLLVLLASLRTALLFPPLFSPFPLSQWSLFLSFLHEHRKLIVNITLFMPKKIKHKLVTSLVRFSQVN